MPNTRQPKKRHPAPPKRRRPHHPAPRPPHAQPPATPGSTRELATRVFHQLLEEKATPETVVAGLRTSGLDAESVGELLRAVRGCIEFAEGLPEDVEDVDADEVTDYLAEDLEIDPDLAIDVAEAFYSLGDEV